MLIIFGLSSSQFAKILCSGCFLVGLFAAILVLVLVLAKSNLLMRCDLFKLRCENERASVVSVLSLAWNCSISLFGSYAHAQLDGELCGRRKLSQLIWRHLFVTMVIYCYP